MALKLIAALVIMLCRAHALDFNDLSVILTRNDISAVVSSIHRAPHSNNVCYGAWVSSYYWCSGYTDAGYSCAGEGDNEYCAASSCIGDCTACAEAYPDAVLDETGGRCCSSIGADGTCEGACSGEAPPNPFYGFPDNKPSLIIEGAMAYPNGPSGEWNKAVYINMYSSS
jgi:hypothetical protein